MKEKTLILKAEQHNWGLISNGDWEKVIWYIYSDRSYDMKSFSVPTRESVQDLYANNPQATGNLTDFYQKTGKMTQTVFDRLTKAMETEPWRNPSIGIAACDGVAWQIEQYSPDGSVKRSSGELDYIYGHQVLEAIAYSLPFANRFGSNAYCKTRDCSVSCMFE